MHGDAADAAAKLSASLLSAPYQSSTCIPTTKEPALLATTSASRNRDSGPVHCSHRQACSSMSSAIAKTLRESDVSKEVMQVP